MRFPVNKKILGIQPKITDSLSKLLFGLAEMGADGVSCHRNMAGGTSFFNGFADGQEREFGK